MSGLYSRSYKLNDIRSFCIKSASILGMRVYRLYMSAIISTSSSAASCCAFMGSMPPSPCCSAPASTRIPRRSSDPLLRTAQTDPSRFCCCCFSRNLQNLQAKHVWSVSSHTSAVRKARNEGFPKNVRPLEAVLYMLNQCNKHNLMFYT